MKHFLNFKKFTIEEYKADRYVWIFIGLYIIVFISLSYFKLNSFSYGDFDLAIMEQILWNMWQGSLFNSILGVDFLGNHLHFILFLLAPFYKIYPHTMLLLGAQSLFLGLGAWPVYLLAKKELKATLALFVSLMYLFYPPLAYLNLFEFHPVAFSTFFLLFTFYFFYCRRFLLFCVFMILALLCQENIALGIAGIGLYALVLKRSWKWVLTPFISAVIYFFIGVFILLPFFNKHTLCFISLYSHFGSSYSEIFTHLLIHPLETFKILFQSHKLYYLMELFAPLSFISFLSPATLIPLVPFLLQHFLSSRFNEITIYFHYTAELIPFIFVSFIFGFKRLLMFKKIENFSWSIVFWLGLIFVLGNLWLGPYFCLPRAVSEEWVPNAKDLIKREFLLEIPPKAAVVTTFEFLPFLTQRTDLYSFHHVYYGFYTMSNKPYVLPAKVSYALIDFNDKLTFSGFFSSCGYKNLVPFLKEGAWGVVDVLDSIVFFKKGFKDGVRLWSILNAPPKPEIKTCYVIENAVEFLGYDTEEEGDRIKVVFYWRCLKKTNKDISVFFHLVDKKGCVLYETLIPLCWRAYPTYVWKKEEYIQETKFLPFADLVKEGLGRWKMGFYDFLTHRGYMVNSSDILGRIDLDVE